MDENEPKQGQPASSETVDAKSPGGEPDEAWQPRLWSRLILLIVLFGYGIALVVANSSKVKISFLFASINVSKIWLILLCLVLGLLSGVLVSEMYRHRKIERDQLEWQAEQGKKS